MTLIIVEGNSISDSVRRPMQERERPRLQDDLRWVENVKGGRLKKAILRFLLTHF